MATATKADLGVSTASAGLRLFAFALDGLIWFIIGLCLSALTHAGLLPTASFPSIVFITAIGLYLIFSWWYLQATPGMLLSGLQLTRHDALDRPGFLVCLARLPALLLAIAPLGLGLLTLFTSPQRQALHDKLTGTRIIVDNEANKPLSQLLAENP